VEAVAIEVVSEAVAEASVIEVDSEVALEVALEIEVVSVAASAVIEVDSVEAEVASEVVFPMKLKLPTRDTLYLLQINPSNFERNN
jgi:hypothetical protein